MTLSAPRIAWMSVLLVACSGAPEAPPEAPPAVPPAVAAPAAPAGDVPVEAAPAPAYVCPMHPEETSNDADAKCGKCGMDLVEAKPDAVAPGHDHGAPGHDHGAAR